MPFSGTALGGFKFNPRRQLLLLVSSDYCCGRCVVRMPARKFVAARRTVRLRRLPLLLRVLRVVVVPPLLLPVALPRKSDHRSKEGGVDGGIKKGTRVRSKWTQHAQQWVRNAAAAGGGGGEVCVVSVICYCSAPRKPTPISAMRQQQQHQPKNDRKKCMHHRPYPLVPAFEYVEN
jgi:hypothetical protein